MNNKEFNDYVFSRLYEKSHYLVMESGYVGSMIRLREYLSSKDEYKAGLDEENFKIFNEGANAIPTITLIHKKYLPTEVIAAFFDALGLDKQADSIRISPKVNIIVVADCRDAMVQMAYDGMVLSFEKWVDAKKKTDN